MTFNPYPTPHPGGGSPVPDKNRLPESCGSLYTSQQLAQAKNTMDIIMYLIEKLQKQLKDIPICPGDDYSDCDDV